MLGHGFWRIGRDPHHRHCLLYTSDAADDLLCVDLGGRRFILELVRFPPTATKEIQYLNAKGALTYTDIAGDPVLYGNLPPREISMKDVFRSGDSSKKFKIAEGQWYRYAPSYVFFFQAEDGIRDSP
eukprot:Filipodium_phascolosomae@DN900_c0_g1_i1.p1